MNYANMKSELDTGHPDTGAYSVDNAQAATELNAINRPAAADMSAFLQYLAVNRSRTNDGGDTVQTSLLGRLRTIAESAVGDNVFGRTGSNDTVTNEAKHAAQMFVTLVATPTLPSIDLSGTEPSAAFDALGPPGAGGVGVWKDPDIAALKGLSQNKQSRAQEIASSIDFNGIITESHVANARAL